MVKYPRPKPYKSSFGYTITHKKHKIVGKLTRTKRTVKPIRMGKRTIYKDTAGKTWIKAKKIYWKFPEEVEY